MYNFCSKNVVMTGVTVRLEKCAVELILASQHDRHDPRPSVEVEVLVAHFKTRLIKIIISYDDNAHHTVWESTDSTVPIFS